MSLQSRALGGCVGGWGIANEGGADCADESINLPKSLSLLRMSCAIFRFSRSKLPGIPMYTLLIEYAKAKENVMLCRNFFTAEGYILSGPSY